MLRLHVKMNACQVLRRYGMENQPPGRYVFAYDNLAEPIRLPFPLLCTIEMDINAFRIEEQAFIDLNICSSTYNRCVPAKRLS